MYEIEKVNNYKEFARLLEKKTGCSVRIKIIDGVKHIHYQLNDKYDMSLGVLCIDHGMASFAPFSTLENAKNEQYINVQYMPQFEDFAKLLGIFQEMFVTESEDYNE